MRTAAGFDADVTVANVTTGRGPASARSLNAVATLGVRHGDEILVRASGPQAEEALAAIRRLADDDFGDPQEARPQPVDAQRGPGRPSGPPAAGLRLRAAGAPGIAGDRHRRGAAAAGDSRRGAGRPSQDREADWAALERALIATAGDIRRARASVAGRASDYDAAIFDAHLLFLEDEALLVPRVRGSCGTGRTPPGRGPTR